MRFDPNGFPILGMNLKKKRGNLSNVTYLISLLQRPKSNNVSSKFKMIILN